AIDHIINSATKSNYMLAGQINIPIVFRGPNGPAAGVGAQHSQNYLDSVCGELKGESKEELKEEMKVVLKEEMKNELKEKINEELKEEMHEELKEEMFAEIQDMLVEYGIKSRITCQTKNKAR
nr:pyruvate dehydrogenase E1 component subunit beta-1, mitochondrial [Tanacetum cinerariifolium]